jgi:hypothetical protein
MLSSKFLRWGAAGVCFWQKCAWGHAKTHEDAIVAVDASDTGAVELRDFSADFACAFGDSCNPPSLIASCSGASTACAGKLWATAKFQLRRNVTKQSESIYVHSTYPHMIYSDQSLIWKQLNMLRPYTNIIIAGSLRGWKVEICHHISKVLRVFNLKILK